LSGFVDADDPYLGTVLADETNGADPDLVVDSDLLFFDGSEPPLSVSLGAGRGTSRKKSPVEPGQQRKGATSDRRLSPGPGGTRILPEPKGGGRSIPRFTL
jgi:hypothetical protein